MTVRTRAELNSDADTYIPDNAGGEVSAADVRVRIKDLADSAFLPEEDTSDDIEEGEDNLFITVADRDLLDLLSATTPIDLDAINTRVNALDAAIILMGTWDASGGSFPGSGSAQAGESWIVSVGGTVNSVAFTAGDRIIAITDNASTSTFASNWFKADYTDAVQSVNGATGAVTVEGIIHAASAKSTLADNDEFGIVDSAASNVLKRHTWANLKAGIWAALGALINGGTGKTTPVDADLLAIADSEASNASKKLSWANLKATLKTYFDGLYPPKGKRPVLAKTANYTLALADAGYLVTVTTASSATITIPTTGTVAFTAEHEIEIASLGTGTVFIDPDTGITINGLTATIEIDGQYGGISLTCLSTGSWLAIGKIAS